MTAITEAIEAHFGERCPVYVPGCPICDAWDEYDHFNSLARRYDDALARINDLTAELEHLRREVSRACG